MNPSIFVRKGKKMNFKIYNSLIFEEDKVKAQHSFFFVRMSVLLILRLNHRKCRLYQPELAISRCKMFRLNRLRRTAGTGSVLIKIAGKDLQELKRHGQLPGIKGRASLRTEESFYENPFPECICRSKKAF